MTKPLPAAQSSSAARRASIVLLAFACALPASISLFAAAPAARPDPLEDANRLFRDHKFQEAADAYAKIIAGNADVATKGKAQFDLGLVYCALEKRSEAIAEFEKILASGVNDSEPGGELMETNRNYRHRACIYIADCYEALGNNRKSLEYALLARDKYPYVTWCGTCAAEENAELNAYIVKRAVAAGDLSAVACALPSTDFFWHWLIAGGGTVLGLAAVALVWRRLRRRRALAAAGPPQAAAAPD